MRSFKKFGVLAVVFALSAIGAGTASAAQFTASATGELSGRGTLSHTFTTNAGQIKCWPTAIKGAITSTASSEQHVTVNYSGCTAFGFANVHISPATYNLTANGTYHIKNTITMNTTLGCHVTIHPQTRGSVVYGNLPGGYLSANFYVTGLSYTATGGLCGASGSNGTYDGWTESRRAFGGSLSHDW